jgi:RNA polymerase sigma-70 factor (ECF subfamily)
VRSRSTTRPRWTSPRHDEEAWLRLRRERVQAALSKLPDQQREALELAYFGGFTQSELAERLGQPIGTIKSRMFSGLARLREILDETETEPWPTTHSTT